MGLAEAIEKSQREEDELYEAWTLGDYVEDDCPNCGRHRLCECPNKMHRCEKCNWSPELDGYAPVND